MAGRARSRLSVVGNALDHGVGYTPYGDHFATQCGMEVVLANGEVVRTGMGAMPEQYLAAVQVWLRPVRRRNFLAVESWRRHKDGHLAQCREPAGYRPYLITFPREEDIEQVVEIVQPLRLNNVIQNAATIRSLVLDAALFSTKSQYYSGKGPIPDSVAKQIMADQEIGMWNSGGALYGPPPITDALWGAIRDSFAKIPGQSSISRMTASADPISCFIVPTRCWGIPKLTEFGFLNWDGGGGPSGSRQFPRLRARTLSTSTAWSAAVCANTASTTWD